MRHVVYKPRGHSRISEGVPPRPRRLDPELLPQDFDPEYGEGLPDGATLEDELFGDLIGCDSIKEQLKSIRWSFVHADSIGVDRREVFMIPTESSVGTVLSRTTDISSSMLVLGKEGRHRGTFPWQYLPIQMNPSERQEIFRGSSCLLCPCSSTPP